VGQSYRLKVTPQGQVIMAEGLDALNRRAAEKIPEGDKKQDALDDVKDMFCLEGLKEVFADEAAIYPDSPVAPGQVWQKKVVWSRIIPIVKEKTMTLKQHRDGVALIESVAGIMPNLQAPPKARSRMLSSIYLSGREKDIIKVNESDGQILEWHRRQWLGGVRATEFVENLTEQVVTYTTIQSVASLESTQLEKRLVQDWLQVIANPTVDINDVLGYVAVPFSFDGKLVEHLSEVSKRFADLRTLLNSPRSKLKFRNFELLTSSKLEKLLPNGGHKNNYAEISDRLDCMASFEARLHYAGLDGENTDMVFVGFDTNNKIICWFD